MHACPNVQQRGGVILAVALLTRLAGRRRREMPVQQAIVVEARRCRARALAIAPNRDARVKLGRVPGHAGVVFHDRRALGVQLAGVGVVVVFHSARILYGHTVVNRPSARPPFRRRVAGSPRREQGRHGAATGPARGRPGSRERAALRGRHAPDPCPNFAVTPPRLACSWVAPFDAVERRPAERLAARPSRRFRGRRRDAIRCA
ncbi:hypothetical protein SAMN05192539_10639 [Paraburkholderia diazotrophica]|uniref:Uncharacterized protein n=1 Tax=Paraburkholderia diazotrophica TaxID=667676 RepID=A0A1H7EHA3_9BURK|nr:hypothetical protein SAMN05192539_10639 [Paraburkholderia diazotrophica]